MRQFALRVAAEIDSRGVLDVLRQGVKDRGVQIDLAYFRPGHTLAAGALDEYNANVLTVARQLHFSFRDPQPVGGHGVLRQRAARRHRRAEEPEYRAERRPRHRPVPRPGPERSVLRQAHPRALRCRSGPRVHHDAAARGGIPSSCRSTSGPTGREGLAGRGIPRPVRDTDYSVSYLWEISGSGITGWRSSSGSCTSRRRTRRPARLTRIPRRGSSRGSTSGTPCRSWSGRAGARGGAQLPVEHSAGSGKSNTIAWLAHRLSNLFDDDNQPVFHKVIVITDRVVLDRQLQQTIFQFDHTPGVVKKIDEDSAQLAEALEDATSKIIISTLQMYPYVLEQDRRRRAGRPAVRGDHRRGALLPGRGRGGAAQAGARRQRGAARGGRGRRRST